MEPTTQGETVKTELPQLPRAWDLFKSALKTYKEHWSFILTLFTVPFILTAAGGIMTKSLNGIEGNSIHFSAAEPQSLAYFVLGAILLIAGGVFSYIATIGFIHFLSEKSAPVPTSVKESYKIGARLFFPFIWVGILTGLAVYGGFILFIVPGIILSLYLSFVLYIFVDEKKRGLDALTQSWNYTKGYAPNIFLKSLFYGLVLLPFIIAFMIVVALLGGVSSKGVSGLNFGAQIVLQLLEQVLIVPLGMIYLYSIYEKVKQNKIAQGLAFAPEVLEKKRRTKLIALSVFAPLMIIIGIGSAIVLTSLNVAREKAKEAASVVESETLPFLPYENKEAGITMQYPSNWVPADPEGQGIATFSSVTQGDKALLTDFVDVVYVPFPAAEKNTTLDKEMQVILESIASNSHIAIIEKKSATLGGVPAVSLSAEITFSPAAPGGKPGVIVKKNFYAVKNGALYGLSLTYNKAKSPAQIAATEILFGRMLESYKIK